MRYSLKMPKVGDAVDTVVIMSVLVGIGDRVSDGQALLLVETDKAQVEIPAHFSGVVREILVSTGDEVSTGSPTFVIEG
jgi:pyruvate/2-oxoglutarate dehydrogenase complex dihydrolipoamide acyltransferase (E2) component